MKLCDKKNCSGCSGCYNICPKNAIKMEKNDYGFLYPIIDKSKCISCGLCELFSTELTSSSKYLMKSLYGFAVKAKDEKQRIKSQSGGLAYILSKTIIDNGGCVYACIYDDNLHPVHVRVDNVNDLEKTRGSKYVQSDISNCMKKILSDLKSGTKVLFIGTPCQVASVKVFLQIKKVVLDNFYCCDLICHGVPSADLLERYISFLESKHNKKISSINLRDKMTGGWHVPIEKIIFEDGSFINSNLYNELFYSNMALRYSCENCSYTRKNRISDITIADCWGFEKMFGNIWEPNKGVSLALIQTNKGKKLFDDILEYVDKLEIDVDKYSQEQMVKSANVPYLKKQFLKDYNKLNFDNLLKKYTSYGGIITKIKRKILKMMKRW